MKKHYDELFKRNQNIISLETQSNIKKLRVLVAGCGSVGGAFIEAASRIGVLNYKLAEPDTYDWHNLNRQFVYPSDIGKNKAIVHAERLQKLFAGCEIVIDVVQSGVNSDNVKSLLENIDLIFDGVDVTTVAGINAKLMLHECAAEKKLPVFSALDLGFKQWIRFYDYRTIKLPLDGRLDLARKCQNPLKALFAGFCTTEELSFEILEEVIKLLTMPGTSACQLGCCCHLLAAFTGPLLIRFAEQKNIPEIINFDLMRSLENSVEAQQMEENRLVLLGKVNQILSEIL
jgi:hypothetical protein